MRRSYLACSRDMYARDELSVRITQREEETCTNACDGTVRCTNGPLHSGTLCCMLRASGSQIQPVLCQSFNIDARKIQNA